jgi:hypothetical protein
MRREKNRGRPLSLRNISAAHWVKGLRLRDAPSSEKALTIFQPDILIPDQFRSTYARTVHLESEKILMLAVLWDAVACFQANLGAIQTRKQQLFNDAEQWILAADPNYLFSFEYICAVLGFEPEYLRRGLMAWKDIALTARATPGVTS